MRNTFAAAALGLLALAFTGCPSAFKVPEPGPDFALIADHRVEGTAGFDYALVEIDGQPIRKEKLPPLVDMNPRAIAKPGKHTFKAQVAPHVRAPDELAREVTFTAEVEGGTTYFVGTMDGQPVLKRQ